jgi:hypothetical protein
MMTNNDIMKLRASCIESAIHFKCLMSKYQRVLEAEIGFQKMRLNDTKGLTKKEIKADQQALTYLESLFPTQLYRLLSRWIKREQANSDK